MARALICWVREKSLRELADAGGFELRRKTAFETPDALAFRRAFVRALGASNLTVCACGLQVAEALPHNFRGVSFCADENGERIRPEKAALRIQRLLNGALCGTVGAKAAVQTLLLNEPWDVFLICEQNNVTELAKHFRLLTADILLCGLPESGDVAHFIWHGSTRAEDASDWREARILGEILAKLGIPVPPEFNFTPQSSSDSFASVYSAEEELVIQKRLEDLGYI